MQSNHVVRYALVGLLGVGLFSAASCSDSGKSDGAGGSAGSTADASTGGSGGGAGLGQGGTGGLGTGGTGGTAGTGGGAGTGGTAGMGGGTAGGSGMAGGGMGGMPMFIDPNDESLELCPGAQLIDPAVLNLDACTLCDDALCVPEALLTGVVGDAGGGTLDLLADCPAGDAGANKCVPRSFVAAAGDVRFKDCTSLAGAEGRCVNRCIPQVADLASVLPQDNCAANELCAPCFFPTDGSESGACGFGCDPGPTQNPVLFDSCCGSLGQCVPASLVPPAQAGALGPDSCTATGDLCAPISFIDALISGTTPTACTSLLGAEGRCVPACIPQVAGLASFLPQDVCQTAEVCAPCFDPVTGASTGACDVGPDMPTNPTPVTFPKCCSDTGICVDPALVPPEQQGVLGPDTCATGELCAPAGAASSDPFPSCNTVELADGGVPSLPGACVPACTVPTLSAALTNVITSNGGTADQLQGDCALATDACIPCTLPGPPPINTGLCPPAGGGDAGADASP